MAYLKKLYDIVGKKHVIEDIDILEEYSGDNSFTSRIMPVGIASPGSQEEVKKIVEWANETNTPLVPVSSGGPHFHGGTVPGIGGAVIVDMSRMNKIIRVDRNNRVVMVEPGVTFGELIPAMEKEGLAPFLPLAPRSSKSVLASALEREPITMPRYHWDNQDPLRCLEVIYGSGDLLRTGSAVGPGTLEEQWEVGRAQVRPMGPSLHDFAKLVQGGQGTMGIVTWATLACRPFPSIKKVFFIPSQKIDPLIDFTYKILWKKLGQDCLILNKHNLASLIGNNNNDISALRERLPQWAAIVSIEGFGKLPEDRVEYQSAEFMEVAQSFGLEPATRLLKSRGEQMAHILTNPSDDPFWKLRFKGGCQDLFFLSTLDMAPQFIKKVKTLSISNDFPVPDIGVTIQPTLHGTNCHCEFNFSYDMQNASESDRVRILDQKASKMIAANQGFFSRPYGSWSKIAYGNNHETVVTQRKIKEIFDPNNIMNPGKLCF